MAEKNNRREEDDIQLIRGWTFPKADHFPKTRIEAIMDYMPEDGDIIIASYPKTGTTWMQYIVLQILSKGESFPSFDDVLCKVVPFLEMSGIEVLSTLSKPKVYKHHLPYHLVQKNANCKYIYTYRNPEDTVVSYYHFLNNLQGFFKNNRKKELNEFFENFLSGKMGYGRYFDHVLTYYEHKEDQNLLLVSYEKLSRNRKEEILRIAKFLGGEYYDYLLKNESVLREILERTSFDYMKKNLFLTQPDLRQEGKTAADESEKVKFFRKGIVGDGKQVLNPDQLRRLREMAGKVVKGTELYEEWITE